MKFCNQCGTQLSLEDDTRLDKQVKRLDDYVDGIFWITIFGLGMILGGMVLIKEALHLSDGILIAYLILSSTTFLTVFGICLWQIIRISQESKKVNLKVEEEQFDTNKLAGAKSQKSLEEGMSVVEETTRTLEAVPREHETR
jgi:hypothetical protein